MISPIRATPAMTTADLANVINYLADQVESENRTKVIKDEDGVNRILIGRGPKGNYVIAISVKGKDVIQALEK